MKFKKIWITSVSLITLLMIVKINVNSNHITPNNSQMISSPRTSSSNSKIRIRITHPNHNINHLTQIQIRQYLHQMQTQTLSEIQSNRSLHGVPPVTINTKLNHLAKIRARQIAQRFDHYDRKGHPYTTDDAYLVHLPRGFRGSENIASTGLGNCITLGDPKTYHNHNGKQMAEMADDAMMNHDQLEANGHRKNILDQENTLVGIGTAYNPLKHEFYLAEDFGNHNSASSEDVNQVSSNQIKQSEVHIVLKTWKQDIKQIFMYSINFFKRFIEC